MTVKQLIKFTRRYFDGVTAANIIVDRSQRGQHYKLFIPGGHIAYCYHINHNIYHIAITINVPKRTDVPSITIRATRIAPTEVKRIFGKAVVLITAVRDGTL